MFQMGQEARQPFPSPTQQPFSYNSNLSSHQPNYHYDVSPPSSISPSSMSLHTNHEGFPDGGLQNSWTESNAMKGDGQSPIQSPGQNLMQAGQNLMQAGQSLIQAGQSWNLTQNGPTMSSTQVPRPPLEQRPAMTPPSEGGIATSQHLHNMDIFHIM